MSDSNAYLQGMTKTLETLRSKVSRQQPGVLDEFEQLMARFETLKTSTPDNFEAKKVDFETELLELGQRVK
jgi:hypothetical protein